MLQVIVLLSSVSYHARRRPSITGCDVEWHALVLCGMTLAIFGLDNRRSVTAF